MYVRNVQAAMKNRAIKEEEQRNKTRWESKLVMKQSLQNEYIFILVAAEISK